MAEVVVGPFIEVLLDNLVELSKNQIGLVRHFKDDLKKLQTTLSMVNGFLNDAKKKQVTSDAFKIWLRELEDLAFEADNIIDEFNYHLLSKKVGATTNKRVKRKDIKYILRIEDINDKLELINQRANEFGLQNIAAQAPVYAASASSQTDSDPIFLGREKDVSSIVDTLITAEQRIGKLISLQTLPYFRVGGKKGRGISELGNLKDLEGKLEIDYLDKVRDKNDATCAYLLEKAGLYELKLIWRHEFKICDEVVNDESVLEGLRPHPNLKRLQICGFKGKSLSLWEGLNNLVEIELIHCHECEELSMFVFPVLERLELFYMPNLRKWDDGVTVFPRLKYLKISECWQLKTAPSDFPCLEELEIDDMKSSLALENICGIKLTSLKKLKIWGIEGLECLPDWLFSNNHNLTELEIMYCPNMTHLVPHMGGAGGAPSPLLRELKISNCRSLRELPDDLHSLNWVLNISGCPELKSVQQQQQQHLQVHLGIEAL